MVGDITQVLNGILDRLRIVPPPLSGPAPLGVPVPFTIAPDPNLLTMQTVLVDQLLGTLQSPPGDAVIQPAPNIDVGILWSVQGPDTWPQRPVPSVRVSMEGVRKTLRKLGAALPDVNVSVYAPIFPITFHELTSADGYNAVRCDLHMISATVTLSLGGTSVSRDLPPVPIPVPSIGIPALAAVFTAANFAVGRSINDNLDLADSAVLLIVPSNSPLRTLALLEKVLLEVHSFLAPLASLGDTVAGGLTVTGYLLGVSSVVEAIQHVVSLPGHVPLHFVIADQLNLHKVAYGPDDDNFRREVASVILIGPPGTQFRLFHNQDNRDFVFPFDYIAQLETGDAMVLMLPELPPPSGFFPGPDSPVPTNLPEWPRKLQGTIRGFYGGQETDLIPIWIQLQPSYSHDPEDETGVGAVAFGRLFSLPAL